MIAKINEFLNALAAVILSILPDSPLKPYIDALGNQEWLPMLNWFVPIGNFIVIGAAWLAAITVFYIYQIILRWAKVVGD